jgi:hypothetical protein
VNLGCEEFGSSHSRTTAGVALGLDSGGTAVRAVSDESVHDDVDVTEKMPACELGPSGRWQE